MHAQRSFFASGVGICASTLSVTGILSGLFCTFDSSSTNLASVRKLAGTYQAIVAHSRDEITSMNNTCLFQFDKMAIANSTNMSPKKEAFIACISAVLRTTHR